MDNVDEKNIGTLLQRELNEKRDRLNILHYKTTNTLDILEPKILSYIQNSKSIPNVETASILIGALTSLYRTNLDVNTSLIRSVEKQIDVENKKEGDESDPLKTFDYNMLDKIRKELDKSRKTTSNGADNNG